MVRKDDGDLRLNGGRDSSDTQTVDGPLLLLKLVQTSHEGGLGLQRFRV